MLALTLRQRGLPASTKTGRQNIAAVGHSTREVRAKYTHHELEPLRAAVAAIPSLKL
jgi:hypothetical protein